ncbi:MAG: POTRA domain-containing protein [Bacteroidota bacterium]
MLYFCRYFFFCNDVISLIVFLDSITMVQRNFWLLVFLLLALISGNACNNIKYLSEDEAIVTKNVIKFDSKLTIEKKNNLSYELKSIIQTEPNSKFLGLFRTRLWIHNRTGRDTTKKFKRWLYTRVGELPALYNADIASQTAEDMQYYLNNKGYFNANVYPETAIKHKKATTTYTITTNPIYVIDEVDYQILDTAVSRIVIQNQKQSLLRKGEPVEIKTFDSEKNRISRALRNEGYAYFYPDYINFKSFDSTAQKS